MSNFLEQVKRATEEFDGEIFLILRRIENVKRSMMPGDVVYKGPTGTVMWSALKLLFTKLKAARAEKAQFLQAVKTGKWR